MNESGLKWWGVRWSSESWNHPVDSRETIIWRLSEENLKIICLFIQHISVIWEMFNVSAHFLLFTEKVEHFTSECETFHLFIKVCHDVIVHLAAEETVSHSLEDWFIRLVQTGSINWRHLWCYQTHSVSDCFSVNTLRTKSASLAGSKVDGTIRYSPGGRRSLALTSRRLMKVSERAQDEWRRKKSFFIWTLWQPRYCRTHRHVTDRQTDRQTGHRQTDRLTSSGIWKKKQKKNIRQGLVSRF